MTNSVFDQHHWFYASDMEEGQNYSLDDFALGHVRTLRLKPGDIVLMVDGKGRYALSTLDKVSKQNTTVRIGTVVSSEAPSTSLNLAVAFTKNNSRNEWLLEKATELGVHHIIPLVSDHSQKVYLKRNRAEHILVSAMLQSRRLFLPHILEDIKVADLQWADSDDVLVAHCQPSQTKENLVEIKLSAINQVLLLIGPEGDFSQEEVQLLLNNGARDINLSKYRLRTETAAIQGLGVLSLKLF